MGVYRLMPVTFGSRMLILFVQEVNGLFGVAALETKYRPFDRRPARKIVAGVFDDHAHDIVGERRSLDAAKSLAEKYARRWLKDQKIAKKCGCKDIGVGAK